MRLPLQHFTASSHALGGGRFYPHRVACDVGGVTIALQREDFAGAEIVSPDRYRCGTFTARMRTPLLPGSISAFFLYQAGAAAADEIDIEIFNDGSRRALCTTWCAGVQTHSTEHALPFAPDAAFHDYTIVRRSDEVVFMVDGVVLEAVEGSVPQQPLDIRLSGWWPLWVPAPLEGGSGELVIAHVIAG